MRRGVFIGGGGGSVGITKGAIKPYSSKINSYNADLIVASIQEDVVIIKDTHYKVGKQKAFDAICRLISRRVFGKKYKMFIPAFEEDIKKAIEDVISKHHFIFDGEKYVPKGRVK